MAIIAADSFARPDADVLGNAETGQAWEISNVGQPWGIVGEKATRTGGTQSTHHQAVLNVGFTDHEVSAKIDPTSYSSGSSYYGLVCRYVNNSNLILLQLRADSLVSTGIYTLVNGIYTLLSASTGLSPAGSRITMRCEGTTITGLVNGVVVCSGISSALATATRCGLNAFYNSNLIKYDDVIVRNKFGQPAIRDGSSWVGKPAKVWDGSVWVTKPMKIWAPGGWRRV